MSLFGKIRHAVGRAVHTIEHTAGNAVHSVEHAAGNAVHSVEHAAGNAVHSVEHAAAHAVHSVGHAAGNAVHRVERTAVHAVHRVEHAAGHVLHSIVRTAGHALHRVEHAAGHVVHTIEHEAGHAVHTIEHTAGHVVHDIGKVAEGGVHLLEGAAKAAVGLAEDVAKGAFGVINSAWGLVAFRPLRGSEKALAQGVFGSSIPLNKVWICSLSGAGSRPFTVPGFMLMTFSSKIPGLGPVLFVAGVFAQVSDKYIIFAGPAAYRDGIRWFRGSKTTPGQNLVHELTHVWQGHNHTIAWTYVFNSLANQCSCCIQNESTNRAYFYTPGLKWSAYAAEKQASLVEDWFVNTRNGNRDLAREPYIIKNIRAGRPLAA